MGTIVDYSRQENGHGWSPMKTAEDAEDTEVNA
jgi:hypothetical protein